MPSLFHDTLNSAVIGMYDRLTPVATAVFFSPTRALTAHHVAKSAVGDILTGKSNPSMKPVRKWTFTVVASSPKDDLVVLEIARGPPARIFLPLGPCEPISEICFSQVWLATFGITVARKFVDNSIDINVGPSVDVARVAVLCQRHFAYETSTGRGDPGGAIINFDGQLIGLHLGGWSDSSPPPSPETAVVKTTGAKGKAGLAAAALAAAIKNKERAEAMGIADLGSAKIKSISQLAERISVGGYGIYVCTPEVAAMCSTVLSSPAASVDGSGRGCTKRHKSQLYN